MKKILMIILSVGVILGIGGYFLVKESYAATPADPLFVVQEIADDVQRAFTFDDVAKTELEQKILVRRQEQVERMIERDDITEGQLEEALGLMTQQRTVVRERLQVVQKTLEVNQTNERTIESFQVVQQDYDKTLDKQLEIVEKAQEKGDGIGQSIKDDIEEEVIERGRNIPEDLPDEIVRESTGPGGEVDNGNSKREVID